uniref:Transmembrane 9 superfamily member n=1 Tax=Macrostomum lignano TaxID=282301 RepID=A0A1I8FI64_9PLAT
ASAELHAALAKHGSERTASPPPSGTTWRSEEADEDSDNGWKDGGTTMCSGPPKHKCFFSATIGGGRAVPWPSSPACSSWRCSACSTCTTTATSTPPASCCTPSPLHRRLRVLSKMFRRLGGAALGPQRAADLLPVRLPAVHGVGRGELGGLRPTAHPRRCPGPPCCCCCACGCSSASRSPILGGMAGKNARPAWTLPVAQRTSPEEIPPCACYKTWPVHCLIGGFLSLQRAPCRSGMRQILTAVELYYIYATVVGRQHYTLYGILAVVYIILLSVRPAWRWPLTYFQLSAEDYRWWWALRVQRRLQRLLFVLLYSAFFFYFRSNMSGLLQAVEFFGYSILAVLRVLPQRSGTVSFAASMQYSRPQPLLLRLGLQLGAEGAPLQAGAARLRLLLLVGRPQEALHVLDVADGRLEDLDLADARLSLFSKGSVSFSRSPRSRSGTRSRSRLVAAADEGALAAEVETRERVRQRDAALRVERVAADRCRPRVMVLRVQRRVLRVAAAAAAAAAEVAEPPAPPPVPPLRKSQAAARQRGSRTALGRPAGEEAPLTCRLPGPPSSWRGSGPMAAALRPLPAPSRPIGGPAACHVAAWGDRQLSGVAGAASDGWPVAPAPFANWSRGNDSGRNRLRPCQRLARLINNSRGEQGRR